MYLELAEALDCPECRSGFGLVAFVGEAEGRRVLRGRLGCPLCEVEYPIGGGAIHFGGGGVEPSTELELPDLPVRLAALLGVGERRGVVVLLGPGLGRHGADVARLAERAEVIAWLDPGSAADGFDLADLEAGLDPIHGASATSWPVRERFLDGVALGLAPRAHLDEAARCLKPGGRLVILGSESDDAADPDERLFRELARDETTWVGERI